ncbi:DUF5133 domain-containing protein [Streptomyces sp. NPDC059909]|uniref:DUF5133 domain-containing protein n=1 Tax=Streptomyces sp. NPDC059909 TaxID=3346998 RepID=UPI00365F0725
MFRVETTMLMPNAMVVAEVLSRYRRAQARMLRDPRNPAHRRQLEDAAYTLSVLMGQRTVRTAVLRAAQYLSAQSSRSAAHRSRPTESLAR